MRSVERGGRESRRRRVAPRLKAEMLLQSTRWAFLSVAAFGSVFAVEDSRLDLFSLSNHVIVDDFRRDHALLNVDDSFPSFLLEPDSDLPLLLGFLRYSFLYLLFARFRLLFPPVLLVLLVR